LEPGEIPKSKQNTERTSKTTVDEQPHINVINRKTRVSITGKSAPSLKNLVNWLDKNPDWDIDSASIATIAKAKVNNVYHLLDTNLVFLLKFCLVFIDETAR
jgi:hypothetical protein